MPENKLMPPYGIQDFEKIRQRGFYYVDKTGLIKEILENSAEVTLFTRPRRFGKSLNLSMLQNFFEIGRDPSLFDGLAISSEKEICERHMGKYPVISIKLSDIIGIDFESAKKRFWTAVFDEVDRHDFLMESDRLSENDRRIYKELLEKKTDLEDSLLTLSRLLYKHYGKKVIILIDEYDVPLNEASKGFGDENAEKAAKAKSREFYENMLKLIRAFMSSALKGNKYLEFAVLTGCLRVAKESIFTGMNNLRVCSVLDEDFDERFGFTEDEVKEVLEYYDKGEYLGVTKEWYDGYRFGDADIYCPWDVVCWCSKLIHSRDDEPEDFWANSSGNDIINTFADMADGTARDEMAGLLEGKPVAKKIKQELTYGELYSSIDNVWSMFLNTGYLTPQGKNSGGTYDLVIPNKEIRHLFCDMFDEWFIKRVKRQAKEGKYTEIYRALEDGNAETIEAELSDCLMESVSHLDGGNNDEQKESYYHGMLIGILNGCGEWLLQSNREAGLGRADILIKNRTSSIGIVVEVKRTKFEKDLEKTAQTGLNQIEEMKYAEYFKKDKLKTVRKYCIAFCKKECRVRMWT